MLIVVEVLVVVGFEGIVLEVVVMILVVDFDVVVEDVAVVVDVELVAVLVLLEGACEGVVALDVISVKTVELVVDLEVGAMVDVVGSTEASGLQSLSNLVDSLQPPGNDSSHILIVRFDRFL